MGDFILAISLDLAMSLDSLPQIAPMPAGEIIFPGSNIDTVFPHVLVPVVFLLVIFLGSHGLGVYPHRRL